MKNINIKIIAFVGSLVLILSCTKKDFLERTPSDFISEKEVFTNLNNAEKFLNNLYNDLPSFFKPGGAENNWALCSATDEAEQIWDSGLDANFFNAGSWNPQIFPLNQLWANYYGSIRRANIFIKNYSLIPEDPQDSDRRQRLFAEAHALKAFYYFELYKMWGGLPIIDTVLNPSDIEGVLLDRNTEDEVIEHIKKEISIAVSILAPKRNIDAQFGRMTGIACKFLLARTLLYHASALHNPDNKSDRWVQAATAAKEALDIALANNYQLCTTDANGKRSYERIFLELNNPEAIFTRNGTDTYWDQVSQPWGFGGWAGTCPTQDMVDAYEMTNGLPISNPVSGYNPQNPYVNRDPRFYQTILHHGMVWKGKKFDVSPSSTMVGRDHPQTNVYLRKFMLEELNITNGMENRKYRPWILMRLAELYLNYAEAQNEAAGPDASVYNAINTIRKRASMPNIPAGLSKEQMRESIRQERRIELAFEDHRFWDVRRWKIAEITDNRPIHSVFVSNAGVYEYRELEPRVFESKHYLFPIPQSEIDKNPRLRQNLGW